jgi:hypothetical protein
VFVLLVVALLFGGRGLSFYVDWLWFGEVGQRRVFWAIWGAQALLGATVGVVMFAALALNLWLARRASPPLTLRFDDLPARARVGRLARAGVSWGLVAAAAGLAFAAAALAASQWETWLLFRHAVPFGRTDPLFKKDIGFYLFTLPFWRLLYGWLFLTLVAATLGALIVYYLDRAVEVLQGYTRVAVSVRVHLSALLGLLALVKAWGFRLDAYNLLFSVSNALVGAGYTDVHARLVALNILAVLALVAAVGFFLNTHYRLLWLPGAVLGLMVAAWLLVGVVYPSTVQQVRVRPNELGLEAPYIRRHIEATRAAYGLERVQVAPFASGTEAAGDQRPTADQRPTTDDQRPTTDGRPSQTSPTAIGDRRSGAPREAWSGSAATVDPRRTDAATIANLRLWDYRPLQRTYQQLQGFLNYYRFTGVDIDRYRIDGRYRQVMLAIRELDLDALPENAKTWVNQRLRYTHGYGVVMSPVNAADPTGRPLYFVRDMPVQTQTDLALRRPQIYFGELTDTPVIVGTKVEEFDYPAGAQSRGTRYEGTGGIPIGSALRRFLFATYLGDANLMISGDISSASRILLRRRVATRVRGIAPFLRFDRDPYPVLADGRVYWIQDAYTTAASYPYSAPFPPGDLGMMGGAYAGLDDALERGFNYIRNSVKVVTDAYDGTVRFYISDPADPVIRAYAAAFPGLLRAMEEMPSELRGHVRYPEDLFRIQAVMFRAFHVTDPAVFYGRADVWAIPTESLQQSDTGQVPLLPPPGSDPRAALQSLMRPQTGMMEPYYVIMRLPGERAEEFLLMLPFTYQGRENMSAWMCARCDGEEYGRLLAYTFPQGVQREGPSQVEGLINQDPAVSQQLSLWNQAGSQVTWGNLLVVPIERAILYVRPLFLVASRSGIPELKRVVLVHEGRVVMEARLEDALDALFGARAPTTDQRPPTTEQPGPAGAASPASLAAQAGKALDEALAAQRRGDWAGYGAALKRLETAVRALQRATASQGVGR